MIEVSPSVALSLLSTEPLRYSAIIQCISGSPLYLRSRTVYADALEPNVVMSVLSVGNPVCVPYITVIFSDYDEAFTQDAVEMLSQTYESIDELRSVDGRVIDCFSRAYSFRRLLPLKTFVCTSLDLVPEVTVEINKLSKTDTAAVESYVEEQLDYSPGLAIHFRNCVFEGSGDIIAVRQDEEILAYLAYTHPSKGTCEMYMIHVRQDHRGKGLGVQLASYYARDRLGAGVTPFYDGAQTPESENTACRAGFTLCREDHRAIELKLRLI